MGPDYPNTKGRINTFKKPDYPNLQDWRSEFKCEAFCREHVIWPQNINEVGLSEWVKKSTSDKASDDVIESLFSQLGNQFQGRRSDVAILERRTNEQEQWSSHWFEVQIQTKTPDDPTWSLKSVGQRHQTNDASKGQRSLGNPVGSDYPTLLGRIIRR